MIAFTITTKISLERKMGEKQELTEQGRARNQMLEKRCR